MVELVVQDYEKNKIAYQNAKQTLQKTLGKNIDIHHVGSTAIPNIVGKNIIDVLVGAKDKTQFELFYNKLTNLGFFASQNSKTDIYTFFASSQSETTSGDIHIHLVIKNTERYNEFLILKNYLLEVPQEAQNYSDHKKQILTQTLERKQYRQIKSEYVSALIERAKQYFKNIWYLLVKHCVLH